MKYLFFIIFGIVLSACQPNKAGLNVIILDGNEIYALQAEANTPREILKQASLELEAEDKVQFHGADLPLDFSLPNDGFFTLQVQRAHTITLITSDNRLLIKTTATTIGQALIQTGLQVYNSDFIDPPLSTPIDSDLTVTFRPARDITLLMDGETIRIKTSQVLVGQALAATGYTLLGLDQSVPAPSEPLPEDGTISIKRIYETIDLQEKAIPFTKKYQYSVDQPAGEQKVLQTGENGLSISRLRIQYSDRKEIKRTTESETIIRQPTDSIIQLSSQTPVLSLETPSGQLQYWSVVQMYATSYSPCRSGTTKCSYGTASGLPVKHGVVALVPSLFNQLVGTRVYIPSYGIGVVGDVGGGFPDGRLWIDLGYSDDDYQSWSGYQTVYFLVPAPANIPAVLK